MGKSQRPQVKRDVAGEQAALARPIARVETGECGAAMS